MLLPYSIILEIRNIYFCLLIGFIRVRGVICYVNGNVIELLMLFIFVLLFISIVILLLLVLLNLILLLLLLLLIL
jgi:hypothetical protein